MRGSVLTWLLIVVAFGKVSSASVVSTLQVTNGGNQGNWGPEEFCPEKAYANGFWLKVHSCKGSPGCDDAGVTGVVLRCSHLDGRPAGHVGSRYGASFHPAGRWQPPAVCPTSEQAYFITSLALKVQKYEPDADNTAVTNLRGLCSNGVRAKHIIEGKELVEFLGSDAGVYGKESKSCPPGSAVCGLSSRVDQRRSNDNTGLNDLKFYCCKIQD